MEPIHELFARFEVDRCGKINYKDFNRIIRKEHHVALKAKRHASDARLAPGRSARPWRKAAEEFALAEGGGSRSAGHLSANVVPCP